MNKFSLLVLLLFLIQAYCKYTKYDGSKLISLSYSPNLSYDATERVCIENFSQEMISYYSWFASYGYCEDRDIPLFCCKNYVDFLQADGKLLANLLLPNISLIIMSFGEVMNFKNIFLLFLEQEMTWLNFFLKQFIFKWLSIIVKELK